jgi:hypothetical protein
MMKSLIKATEKQAKEASYLVRTFERGNVAQGSSPCNNRLLQEAAYASRLFGCCDASNLERRKKMLFFKNREQESKQVLSGDWYQWEKRYRREGCKSRNVEFWWENSAVMSSASVFTLTPPYPGQGVGGWGRGSSFQGTLRGGWTTALCDTVAASQGASLGSHSQAATLLLFQVPHGVPAAIRLLPRAAADPPPGFSNDIYTI